MTASISIRVCTATDAGTVSTATVGIDFISADNAVYSTANRQAYPITAGNYSYEKWLIAYVDAIPDNGCANFRLWTDGTVAASSDWHVGVSATAVTPVNTDSSIATNDLTLSTSSAKFTWHNTALTATAETTQYAVLQLTVDADCNPGNWNVSGETLSYSFEET